MTSFKCPRCGETNTGTPKLHHTHGYTRCEDCGIGMEWESSFLKRTVVPIDLYVPEYSTKSPKTGNILDAQRIYKGSRKTVKFFAFFMPSLRDRVERRKKREGTLKEDIRF